MKPEEAIETIKIAIAEVEWNYPMDYAAALSMAIEALEKQVPKKPRETRCALMCANCGHKITEKGCKKLNRNFIGIERDKEYFNIAEKRIKDVL